MSKQLENVAHDYIRYANCWEDADLLVRALDVQEGELVLSIGSAGDNSFSLLANYPQKVVAVDINKAQLHLIALKKAAIQALDRNDYLQFIGFANSNKRLETYESIKPYLPQKAQLYWDASQETIANGIIHQGKFERYFQLFHRKILPLIHTKKRIAKLFEAKTEKAQLDYYNNKWNNWRWRLLFKLFFSKFVMGRFGRDPAFLKEVEVPVAQFIFEQAERHLSSKTCQTNCFLHYILTGKFGNHLPHYVQEENYSLIKTNIHRLEIVEGLAEQAFELYPTFKKMNLSNIFEYMNQEVFTKVANDFVSHCSAGGKIAYWNLMVPRQISAAFPTEMSPDIAFTKLAKTDDKGFFYRAFWLDERS